MHAPQPGPYPLPPHSHHLHHAQLPPVPQDLDLKRRYLALLPPASIIEICLTFDLHVPTYVKGPIWPVDFNSAIATLKQRNADAATAEKRRREATESSSSPNTDEPVMHALEAPNEEDNRSSAPTSDPPDQASEKEKSPSETSKSSPAPSASPANAPTVVTVPMAHPITQVMPPPYPHQPYPYQYLHASYYLWPYSYCPPPPHMAPGHSPYPPPGPSLVAPYQIMPQPAASPVTTSAPVPSTSAPAPVRFAIQPTPIPDKEQEKPSDDLPSYEEMFAKALAECPNPDGFMAPKELFTWMAANYPVQSNFRASASQALQKAYKRGRFERNGMNRYRLNPLWDGSQTTRRATRRPQTRPIAHGHALNRSSPFTTVPLALRPPSGRVSPGYPISRYSAVQSQAVEEGVITDPYEAAQHILKTINFGPLFKFDGDNEVPLPESPRPQSPAPVPTPDRARLQAHLALLAAQLAALGEENVERPEVVEMQTVSVPAATTKAEHLPDMPAAQSDVVVDTHSSDVALEAPSPSVAVHPPALATLDEGDSDDDDMEHIV